MKTDNNTNIKEIFFSLGQNLEFKAEVDPVTGKRSVFGYAALFDSRSRELFFWDNALQKARPGYEYIERGAFDDCDFTECIMNLEHANSRAIGRISRNLTVQVNERGLFFRIEFEPESKATTEQNDFIKNVEQGIINQCSFQAVVKEAEVIEEGDIVIRTIKKIEKCFDVCGTVMGVYPQTWLTKRNVELSSKVEEVKPEEVKEIPLPELEEPNELEVADADFDILHD